LTSRILIPLLRSVPLRAATLLVLFGGSCAAQSIAAPVEMHLPLLTKVIEYDRTFRVKIDKVVKLGVIYQKSWRPSAEVFDELVSVTSRASFTVCGFPVQIIPIDVSGDVDVHELLGKYSVDLVYLAPVRGVSLEEITRASEEQHFRTITGVPRYVEEGIDIGVDLRNDRPLIVINLTAAKACGADLSAQVLRLARVVE
jgi:hypothetical protein